MLTIRHELETLLIAMIAGIGVLFVLSVINDNNKAFVTSPILPTINNLSMSFPSSSPIDQVSSQSSSDGKKLVIMKMRSDSNGTKTYLFAISEATESATLEPPFYAKVASASSTFTIPYNTFAIDNKHVFLEEKVGETKYFPVFNVSGKPFANGEKFIDVTSAFQKYTSEYALKQVTGWASEQQLIVQTNASDGKSGPSFWFDIGNQSFIQLSTKF